MDRRRVAAGGGVVLLVVVVVLGVAWAAGAFATPEAGVVDRGDWGAVDENRTEVVTTVWVDNPNPLVGTLVSVSVEYDLAMNGVELAAGREPLSLQQGNQTEKLRVDIRNDRLQDWWVRYVRANETVETEIRATAVASLGPLGHRAPLSRNETYLEDETPIVDAMTEAIEETEGAYPSAQPFYEIRDARAEWGAVNRSATAVEMQFTVHNPSEVPVVATPDGIEMTVEANGVKLIRTEGQAFALRGVDDDEVIQPGGTRTFTVIVLLDNEKIDDWFRRHVSQNERSEIDVEFRATIRNPVTDGPVTVPAKGVTYNCVLQTEILVDDPGGETTCGDGE